MLTRLFLALVALIYFAFGLWSLTQPLSMASQLGVDVAGPNGAYEMAGVYGGISLGAATLSAAGAAFARMRGPALWFLVTYMGGYMVARVLAWGLHGAPTSDFYAFIGFEAAVLIGAIAGLRAIAK